jgi:hypothetical protein
MKPHLARLTLARKIAAITLLVWKKFPLFYKPSFPPGRERRARCGYLNQSHGLSPLPQEEDNDAQLSAQTRTLRIRQVHGFNFSIECSTSPLLAVEILPWSDFHEIPRAAGPKRQVRG